MFTDAESRRVIEFTDNFVMRLLGNASDQKLVKGIAPSRKYNTGMLFPASESDSNRRDAEYKSKVAPCSCRVQLKIQGKASSIKLVPSFSLYFRSRGISKPEDIAKLESYADEINDSTMWSDWDTRLISKKDIVKVGGEKPAAVAEDEDLVPPDTYYIRKRYSKTFAFDSDNKSKLDLEDFREYYKHLGDSPKWEGDLSVFFDEQDDGNTIVSVDLTNTYGGKSRAVGEPNWFDVRIVIHLGVNKLLSIECPILDDYQVEAFSSNISYDRINSAGKVLYFSPVARTRTQREEPREGPTFEQVADNPKQGINELIAGLKGAGLSKRQLRLVEESAHKIFKSPEAVDAFAKVSEVYRRCFGNEGRWYYHQLAAPVIAAGRYLTGNSDLTPIVMNVPTAGGKTESFLAAIMWCIFYEAAYKTRSVNIIKYPVTLLSNDQANRLAGYSVVLDEVLGYSMGIGYFVGRKESGAEAEEIVESCPRLENRTICGSEWVKKVEAGGAKQLTCKRGHTLTLGVGDEIFRQVPSILIATWDKFIARSMQRKLGALLSVDAYVCRKHGYMLKPRCEACDSDLSKYRRKPKPGILILDEGHLVRGVEGTLDSHLETDYAEIYKKNSGSYPIPIVSTATIAHITRHMEQLGFKGIGEPIVIPKPEDAEAFYRKIDMLKHEALSLLPQDRPLTWAIPDLCHVYFETLEKYHGFDIKSPAGHPLSHLSQIMIYCSSYKNMNTVQEMIRNHVNPERQKLSLDQLRQTELSGRHFEEEKVASVVENIKNRRQELIYATNIASIGIDIENLNSIFFFGLPSNVNEFIQTLNRTGRRKPAFCLAILGPNKDRDVSYYTYWDPFIHTSNKIVEGVPLNRFARTAIDQTFNNVVVSLLLFYFGPKLGKDFRWCNNLRRELDNGFPEKEVVDMLKAVYCVKDDASGAYERKVEEFWQFFKMTIYDSKDEFISEPFRRQGKFRFNLRNIQPQVEVRYNPSIDCARRAGVSKLNLRDAVPEDEAEVEAEVGGGEESVEDIEKEGL